MADLLGHSSIAITGDMYGHTSDDAAHTAINPTRPAAPQAVRAQKWAYARFPGIRHGPKPTLTCVGLTVSG
ncbi:MAG TPA: hypothetical protein VE197_21110 [Mycobacterium sp.]|nr:hypothetical protein [Mycobacterium sp.]